MWKSKLCELVEAVLCFSIVGLLIEFLVFVATTKLDLTENISRGLVGVLALTTLIIFSATRLIKMLCEARKEARRPTYIVYNRNLP